MNDKEIKRHFEDLLVNKCKKNLPTEVLKVTKFLNDLDLDTDYQEALIRAPVKRKEDAIQYVLRKQQYKLFLALFAKVNQRDYISKYNLLVQALKAKTDKDRYLIAVLNGYHCYELPINVDQLPSELKQKLYEESWSSEIIKCLYNKTNSFFIPRGQDKAKMQALIYYNTFASYNSTMQRTQDACLPVRHDATAEAECIEFGLKRGGFTVRRACTEWTFEMMLVDMHENIKAFRDECCVLVVCIMSHGGNAFIYDRDGKKGMINTIMDVFRELPDYVPAVRNISNSLNTCVLQKKLSRILSLLTTLPNELTLVSKSKVVLKISVVKNFNRTLLKQNFPKNQQLQQFIVTADE